MIKEIAPQIIIDPRIRFGKPTIKGTRLTVEEVLGALAGGMDFADVEEEYGINKKKILDVLNYAVGFLKGVEIKTFSLR